MTTQGDSAAPVRPVPEARAGDTSGVGGTPRGRTGDEPAANDHPGLTALVEALTALRDEVNATRFALPLPSAEEAKVTAGALTGQLDDYLLPRLGRLDAPLLVVVGGSTGAGKSTLVNSLVRAPVSPSGVLRPTTRAPVLVCHPVDMSWFSEALLLPGLPRTRSANSDPDMLQVVSGEALLPGLALLDAPDIDSVVDANRALASQLLAAADLWLFVTTAARYADAVPWEMLRTARSRGTAIALVLDRVPAGGAADEIGPHLTGMLDEHDLGGVPLFVLPEARLDSQGLLTEKVVAPVRDWCASLARSAAARAAVIRQTVEGAIDALGPTTAQLAAAADDQVAAASALTDAVRVAYRAADSTVDRGVQDGALLRGEVLARWQELVGTGDMMRALQARVGRVRDRLIAAVTGRPVSGERFQAALESGLATLLRGAATDAAEQAGGAWRAHPAGKALLERSPVALTSPSPDLDERIAKVIREWQRSVLELVREEAGDKRALARASAYAVNATGLLVMVAVFSATAFIPTGAEIVVAGGTTVAAQKVLEAIFGDQAVRALATAARAELAQRVRALLEEEADRFLAAVEGADLDREAGGHLRAAVDAVHRSKAGVL